MEGVKGDAWFLVLVSVRMAAMNERRRCFEEEFVDGDFRHSAANQCQVNLKTHPGFWGGPAKYLRWSRFLFTVCKSSCK